MKTLANPELRTKSELFKEMVRVYLRFRLQRDSDEERWINEVIVRRPKPSKPPTLKSDEELLNESQALAEYGKKQAKNNPLPGNRPSLCRNHIACQCEVAPSGLNKMSLLSHTSA